MRPKCRLVQLLGDSLVRRSLRCKFCRKAHRQEIPLWLLFIAVQLIDVFWSIFVLLGIDKVHVVPGYTASSPLELYYMPYTQSAWRCTLVDRVWFGLRPHLSVESGGRRDRGTGGVSHWVLDLLVHRPDLALYDSYGKMGFGLWNYK